MSRSSLGPLVLAAIMTFGARGTVSAQVVDPNFLEFTASADHYATDGPAMVSRYDLLLYSAGSGSPARTINLGKPVPDGAGTIRLSLAALLTPLPAGGATYEVRVVAVGPAGSAASAPSNTFSFGAPCSYAVSPASVSVGAGAATGTFTVTTPAGCAWTAASGASWVRISGGAAGSGNGVVTFAVAANTSPTARNAALTIAGQTRGIAQQGSGCTYAVSPLAHSVRRAGGTVAVSVTAPSGCTWTAAEGSTWLSIASGASGSGSGTVTVMVAAYTGTTTRTATATVAGRPVSFSQRATPRAPTGFRVVPR